LIQLVESTFGRS